VGRISELVRCSIVVVTYNGWEHTQECLRAVERELLTDVEIVVVDNASTDGTPDHIRAQFPTARLIQSERNLGFAAGANLGVQRSTGDIVLLLNSDVVIDPGFVDEMLAPFERSDLIGAVASTLVFQRRPDIVASEGIEVFRNGLALDYGVGWSRSDLSDRPVFGTSGGAAAYRRSALYDVGLFPEAYFMYLEDVDLAWRLRLRGWETMLAASAVAAHAVSASSGEGSPFKRRLLARNRIWVLLRCVPRSLLLRYGWRIARYDGVVVASAPLRRDGASVRGRIEALRGLLARLTERRSIQARSTITTAEIERWLRPEPTASELLRIRKQTRELAAD
jgi:GT2 family glycosyltransferase